MLALLGLFVGSVAAGIGPALATTAPAFVWSPLQPDTSPVGRTGASIAYDPATGQLLLFGGSSPSGTGDNGVMGDTWSWDGDTWTELHPSTSPSPRGGASLTYDQGTGRMVLFGGYNGYDTRLGDTWSWNGNDWTQLFPTTSPSPRSAAALTYDPGTARPLLFGGSGPLGFPGDTWIWEGTTWTQLHPTTSPAGRPNAAVAYDAARGNVVLYGGGQTYSYLADMWTWDGTNWAQQHPAVSPGARYGANMDYDPRTGQVVLSQGTNGGGDVRDTWLWDGSTWAERVVASPSARHGASMAYDSGNAQLVMFGGYGGQFLDETVIYGPPLTVQTITFTSTPPATPTVGGSYEATATGGGSGLPVVFSNDGASSVGACTVSATGTVTFTGRGTCYLDADQAGNSTYYPAHRVTQVITINTGSQTITFTSAPPAAPTVGGSYTAAATGGASGLKVVFSADATSSAGACTVSDAGMVSFTGVGTCVIDANQAGNADYDPAPQVQQSLAIAQRPQTGTAATQVSLQLPAKAVTGQAVSLTATVTSAAGIPTGTVTFFGTEARRGGASGGQTTVLGVAVLGGDGSATLTTSSLAVTTGGIIATYDGSPAFAASTTSAAITVLAADTSTTLSSSGIAGGPVVLTATVVAVAPGGGTPTGSVDVAVDGRLMRSVDLDSSGVATLIVDSRAINGHAVTAAYSGAGIATTPRSRLRTYNPSTSALLAA